MDARRTKRPKSISRRTVALVAVLKVADGGTSTRYLDIGAAPDLRRLLRHPEDVSVHGHT